MTTETEKLEKRCTKLTEWVEGAALPPSWEEVFSVTQAARRYERLRGLLSKYIEINETSCDGLCDEAGYYGYPTSSDELRELVKETEKALQGGE